MVQFEKIVSLGYFCSVAMENQRMGLRNVSLPFDWVIASDFPGLLRLLETGFDRFLREEDLYQESKVNPKFYYDNYNHIHFYHDFSATVPLAQQLPAVREKYQRRIARLYDTIRRPTLFVRYCGSEEEMRYINDNFDRIANTLKSYNENNHIVFVYNRQFTWREGIDAYYVKPDRGDTVARTYLRKNAQLKAYILSAVKPENTKENLARYRVDSIRRTTGKVIDKILLHLPRKVYVHHRQADELATEGQKGADRGEKT